MHVRQCTEKHGLNIIHVLQNLPYSSSLCEFGKLKTSRASVVYFSEGNWVLERQKKNSCKAIKKYALRAHASYKAKYWASWEVLMIKYITYIIRHIDICAFCHIDNKSISIIDTCRNLKWYSFISNIKICCWLFPFSMATIYQRKLSTDPKIRQM